MILTKEMLYGDLPSIISNNPDNKSELITQTDENTKQFITTPHSANDMTKLIEPFTPNINLSPKNFLREGVTVAIDIGGTNTRVAVLNGKDIVCKELSFPTPGDLQTLYDTIQNYLNQNIDLEFNQNNIKNVVVAIAGPVDEGCLESKLTNRQDLTINIETLAKNILGYEIKLDDSSLVNDFAAQANGAMLCLLSNQDALHEINSDPQNTSKKTLVVGPGTGLGIAYGDYNSDNGQNINIRPSEEGHDKVDSNIAKILLGDNSKDEEIALFFGQIKAFSYEDLFSGRGLHNLFEHICANQNINLYPTKIYDAKYIFELADIFNKDANNLTDVTATCYMARWVLEKFFDGIAYFCLSKAYALGCDNIVLSSDLMHKLFDGKTQSDDEQENFFNEKLLGYFTKINQKYFSDKRLPNIYRTKIPDANSLLGCNVKSKILSNG